MPFTVKGNSAERTCWGWRWDSQFGTVPIVMPMRHPTGASISTWTYKPGSQSRGQGRSRNVGIVSMRMVKSYNWMRIPSDQKTYPL